MSATVAVEPRPLTDRDWGLLLRRIADKECTPFLGPDVCQGTLLSHLQYVHDVQVLGRADARLRPLGNLTEQGINE